MFSRRSVLAGASLAMAFAVALANPHGVRAADPLKVGILIPGSKSDKGWMESGYDGLVAAQKKYGDKIKVQMIENINYADMDQALTNLASKNDLVIGVGGQTRGRSTKSPSVAPRSNSRSSAATKANRCRMSPATT
jgi:basic membrane protein A